MRSLSVGSLGSVDAPVTSVDVQYTVAGGHNVVLSLSTAVLFTGDR